MRKMIFRILIFCFLIFALCNICFLSNVVEVANISAYAFSAGNGTSGNPYLIYNAEDMIELSQQVAAGNNFEGKYFKVADGVAIISLGNFTPIGSSSRPFKGIFNGNGANFELAIESTGSYKALFGYIDGATIEKLSVSGSVKGSSYVAGVVAYISSNTSGNIVQYVYNTADITATGNYAGGIAGYIYRGTIQYTYNTGAIVGGLYVGGLLGYSYHSSAGSTKYNTVSNGYSSGKVAGSSLDETGGVIGHGLGTGNPRTNLYYDLSVMVNYSQPSGKVKPTKAHCTLVDTGNVKGLYSEDMLKSMSSLGFATSIWISDSTSGYYGYYPQLKVFADNANSGISRASKNSVETYIRGGYGTLNVPFWITNAFDMNELSRRVAEGNTFEGFYFKVADGVSIIDLKNFTPIGSSSRPFKGTFNGNGANFELAIESTGSYKALFGYIDGATIEKLSVSGSVKGSSYVAGVVAYISSNSSGNVVQYVYNTADITATGNYAGGIAAYIYRGTIQYTYNTGEIIGTLYVGGLLGYSYHSSAGSTKYNTVSNGYSSGKVAGSSLDETGGVIGHGLGTGNPRTNLYYDLSVMVNYSQPSGKVKPTKAHCTLVDTGNVKGLYSEDMLKSMSSYGLATGTWISIAKDGDYSYYPQLLVFYNHNNINIKQTSIESVRVFAGNGLGTSLYPFVLRNANDIEDLKIQINNGNTFEDFYFKVILDGGVDSINLGNFTPIGTSSSKPFKGSFDGNNTEFVLDISSTGSYKGLFGYYGGGTIKNLSIKGSVTGGSYVGGVVGYMLSGTISNVYNLATIKGSSYVGGIIGYISSDANNNINFVYNAGNITGTGDNVGGIAGYIYRGVMQYTYNTGAVIGGLYVGGLLGYSYHSSAGSTKYNTISFGYNSGTVAGSSAVETGGVIGHGLGAGNPRSNLYYDLSVIVNYSQPSGKVKPINAHCNITDTSNVRGLFGEGMLGTALSSNNFSTSNWLFLATDSVNAYYPQLKVFSNNSNQRIASESKQYVSVDVSSGLGTSAAPFWITNAFDMNELSRRVAEGNTFEGFYFKVADGVSIIDLKNFTPIGSSSRSFKGTFNGNGANFELAIESTGSYKALFGYIDGATIEKLSVSGSVKGSSYVAGVVAYISSNSSGNVVQYVYNTADITATGNYAGGIAAYIYRGTIQYTYNTGEIIGTLYVGGLLGYSYHSSAGSTKYNTVSNGYSSGKVAGSSLDETGGVIGHGLGTGNPRTNLYYDLSVMVNYSQPSGKVKPTKAHCTLVDTGNVKGLYSEDMLKSMSSYGLATGTWISIAKDGDYSYYPQLLVFYNHNNINIKQTSIESVRVFAGNGLGTSLYPFVLRNANDIEDLKIQINNGNTFEGFYFKVILDGGVDSINLGNFTPIGTSSSKPFKGSFDGNNTEFVLDISSTGSYKGLFGYYGGGTIKNLSIKGSVTGGSYVGGVVGYMLSGTISNVYNLATIKGSSYVGGIIGYISSDANNNINFVYNAGNITGTGDNVGGIAGYIYRGVMQYTYNTGAVIGGLYVGGLLGYSYHSSAGSTKYNTISFGYNSGTVAGSSAVETGGVIGHGLGTGNPRSNLYYDLSVISAYKQPSGKVKPTKAHCNIADTSTVKGLDKSKMITSQMSSVGFKTSEWTFCNNDGKWAFYPQLRAFAVNANDRVKSDSNLSVRTIPFIGTGTSSSPYIISTVADMVVLGNSIDEEFDAQGVYYFVVVNAGSLDLSGEEFYGIGNEDAPFNGYFDGNFVNFNINISTGKNCVGLFGNVGQFGTVKNLSVTGNIHANNNVGGVAGRNEGDVSYVYSIVELNGNSKVGGIVGDNQGNLSIGYNIGNVSARGDYSGGITGFNDGSITDVYNSGLVDGLAFVGGIIGYEDVSSNISNAYYNSTAIEFYVPRIGIKPNSAVGNKSDSSFVKGLNKSSMIGIDIIGDIDGKMNFNSSVWKEAVSSGMYDYYLQIKSFGSNVNSNIASLSLRSVRNIKFDEGNGTLDNPFIIHDKYDMKTLSDASAEDYLTNLYFKVADDVITIDLSELELAFKPIGTANFNFRGVFDGNGSEFIININQNQNYAGLFGRLGDGSVVKNLSTVGNVIGKIYVGGVVGYASKSIIENVYSNTNINGTENVGGILGYSHTSQILDSFNIGDVSGSGNNVGGIVGNATLTDVKYVYNFGAINGFSYVGGIYGRAENSSSIEFAYNRNNIVGISNYVGGICGYLSNSIMDNCYSAGAVRGYNQSYIGGLIGRSNNAAETNSFYDSTIIEADSYLSTDKPIRSSGNKLDQNDFRGVEKACLTGGSIIGEYPLLSLDAGNWNFISNNGIEAFYPQLQAFSNNSIIAIKHHSLDSVSSYIFAGEGIDSIPYIIINENDMKILSNLVALGDNFNNVYFKVRDNAQEFDLSKENLNFVSIGKQDSPFSGVFNGNGVNFFINMDGGSYVGLFGCLGEGAKVYQFSVSGQIVGYSYVGAVAGYSKGEIHSVYSIARINGISYVGGLVGYNEGSISQVYYISQISGTSYVGGLVGYNSNGCITDSYVVARIVGSSNIGGVVGFQEGESILQYLYYNKSIVEIQNTPTNSKPSSAIGNLDDSDAYYGTLIADMTSGILGNGANSINLNSSLWQGILPAEFDLFYPQIKYFYNNDNEKVRLNSKNSVTVDRFTEGDGSEEEPYIIRTAMDMKAVSDLVFSLRSLEGKYFLVAEDIEVIDLTDPNVKYLPIGFDSCYFQGFFDGNGVRFIVDLSSASYYQGIFGFLGDKAIVKNLSVEGTVFARRFAAGVAGRNKGIIENCYNLATIEAAEYYSGGIVGYNENIIRNCYNVGTITTVLNHYAGGIAGYTGRDSLIEFCYNANTVISNSHYSGGIVGYSEGQISNTYNSGEVHGFNSGGIIGAVNNYATTFNSYYDKTKIMSSDLSRKPQASIGNMVDTDYVKGVTTAQLSGTELYMIQFDDGGFVLRANENFVTYYPQLNCFANSSRYYIKTDSLDSVTTGLFMGQGTEANPYYLFDSADMKALSSLVAQGANTCQVYFKSYNEGKIFDLAHPALQYQAIGDLDNMFNGIFIGNGARFVLNINTPSEYQGLFGYVGTDAIIENLTITGKVYGGDFVGAVAGYNKGIIREIFVDAEVGGINYTGGITGYNEGDIVESRVRGEIIGGTLYTAGLVGFNISNIIYSYNFAKVSSNGNYTAGIAGCNDTNGIISYSFNHGDISGAQYVGGIVALNNGEIMVVYSTANILADVGYVGGLVAVNENTLKQGFHSGKVQSPDYAGGVVAINNGTMEKLYYNSSETSKILPSSPYILVSSAVFNITDTEDIKGLTLEEMTGSYAIGPNNMNFDIGLWVLRESFDFTTYFPELLYFKNHEKEKIRDDSLLSVTKKGFKGDGTSVNPFVIYDGYDMNTINEYVQRGNLFNNKYFEVADGIITIDLSFVELGYVPIGSDEMRFNGIIEGKGANFVVDLENNDSDYQGIFHTLGISSKISNITISGQVIGRSYVGALAGRVLGTVNNVTNNATIKSFDGNNVGGITGFNEGTISNCSNKASVNMHGTYGGGIAGESTGSILDSYNKGAIKGVTNIGGITGRNFNIIRRTYNNAEIVSETQAGGIAGENGYIVSHSFNMGSVIATVGIAGGVSGAQRAKGDGTSPSMLVVYNTGSVYAEYNLAGGIIAHLLNGMVTDAYNGGDVSGFSEVGALVGTNSSGNITFSYYDLNRLANFVPERGKKPIRAIDNEEDSDTVKGLLRGQMAGGYSIGNKAGQMNFTNAIDFSMTPSYEQWSFYPQIKVFAENAISEVMEDSLESVRGLTFMIGEGVEDNPYIIMNESDMIALAETVNTGNTYAGKYFLVNLEVSEFDFSESGYPYIPIGNNSNAFMGNFDGNGANFNIVISLDIDYVALFGNVGEAANIHNLSVSGRITGGNYTAGIAGVNAGNIYNVYNQASINGKNYTAGIAGFNNGVIVDVYNSGEIIGYSNVGGIGGYIDGDILNSYNIGIVYGRENIGAIAGFFNTGLVQYSYYDTRILGAYRDIDNNRMKPIQGVGNSINSQTVKGLDKQFMVGNNAIGTGVLQVNFLDTNNRWGVTYNIDAQENYPQLRLFSQSASDSIKQLSNQSTLTTLFRVYYDYNGATENNGIEYAYAINEQHYKLNVPFKYGYQFTGWYYLNDSFEYVKYTDGMGLSLQPFAFENDVSLTAQWEEAYYLVEFVDGYDKVVDSVTVRHGDCVNETSFIPTKPPSLAKIFVFDEWDFDFTQRILQKTKIRAKYIDIDRYYKLTYLDGDNLFYKEQKIEYGHKAQPITDIPVKTYIDDTAYKFVEWDFDYDTEIYESYTIQPIFEDVPRWYNVTFVNFDNSLLIGEQIIEYRNPAFAPLDTPTRPSSQALVYEFIGWSSKYDCVEQDLILIAQYNSSPRHYAVVFYDGDKEVFDVQSIAYSQGAAEPSNTPTQTFHDQTAYKFIGWDRAFDEIIEDTKVYAEFVEVKRYYEVVFVNYDDTEIATRTVEYLSEADAPPTPTREPEEMYIYIFTNWDTPFNCITQSIAVKAVYERSLRPFEVMFIDGNNEIFAKQTVLYGNDATIPNGTPTKLPEGDSAYKFEKWEGNLTNIKADTIIEAKFTIVPRYYFVTFYGYDNSVVLKTERVEYGTSAIAPTPPIPTHPNIAYEYYFDKWDKAFSFVESDLIINAQYKDRMKKFTVTFINGDESVKQSINYGETATPPVPYKSPNGRAYYVFSNWDRDYTNIKADITVRAVFQTHYDYYVVTFYDGNMNVLKRQEITPGANATAPSTATKNKTASKVFIFAGWDKTFTNVQSDLTVKAIFNEYDRYYTVVFEDAYGKVAKQQTVEYGNSATPPSPPPERASTVMYQYTFTGWDKAFTNIKSSIRILPKYLESLRKFEVKFIDGDNKVIARQNVSYGYSATAPSTATKAPSSNYVYIFSGWDKGFSIITENLEVKAEFIEIERWYTVDFIGKDNKTLNTQTVEYKKSAYDPIRYLEPEILDDDYLVAVVGWDKLFNSITSNLIINAIYETVDRWYIIKFFDEGSVLLKEEDVEYGKSATPPHEPAKAGTEDYRYEFGGWSENYEFITSNLEIYATYIQYSNKHTIKFYDGNGDLFEQQIVIYGADAQMPNGIPFKQSTAEFSYNFVGWDKELTNIKEDLNIYALFDSYTRYYVVRFVNSDNVLLKEEEVRYGEDAHPPQGITVPEANEQFYYEIDWSESYNNIMCDMEILLIFVALTKDYSYTFLDAYGSIIKSVIAPYGTEIIAPEPPTKQMTEKYVYTFICWNPEVVEILKNDIVFEPYYDETIREYSLVFLDGDGRLFDEQSIPYGSSGIIPVDIPEKLPTQQYYYQFRMWDSAPLSIRTDTVISSIFDSFLQSYTVTFVDEEDNVLKIHKVPYGTGATEPTADMIPKKSDNQMYTYTFIGWSRPFSNVVEDITVKAVYIGVIRSYTYTFYDDDMVTVLKQVRAIYGSSVEPPSILPTKEGTAECVYEFIGWDKVIAETLTENIDYYAVYTTSARTFKVSFYDGDNFVINIQIVEYGKSAMNPENTPTRQMNEVYRYEFEEWVEDYSYITSDLNVYPRFIAKLQEYTVRFIDYKNDYIDVLIEYGKSAVGKIPTPQRVGYRFGGYSEDITVIKKNTTVNIVYVVNQYQINFHSENADTGYMAPIIRDYDQQVILPWNSYSRKGYEFVGWEKRGVSGTITYYHDGGTFTLKDEGLDLYARWIPITYGITYYLDGGVADNPETYTIEDHLVLKDAYKEDYKFIGWFRTVPIIIEDIEPIMMGLFFAPMSIDDEPELPLDEPINEIPEGTIGQLEFYAIYEYDGYLTLREDSELSFVVADDLKLTELEEREFYDEDNPIYLKGVSVGMTVADIKSNFTNDGVVVQRANGEIMNDDARVGTGCEVILYDDNENIKDKITIFIVGDIDGNGAINLSDAGIIADYLNNICSLTGAFELATDVDGSRAINLSDFSMLLDSLNGKV